MLYLIAAVGIGTIFSNLLKYGFGRPRPDLFPHGSITDTASFPSGHSLAAAIVYLTIGVLLAEAQTRYRLKIYILSLAILIILLVGISRVYLQVHWPSDVLAGWLGMGAHVLDHRSLHEKRQADIT
jgi:undecaprenyl-diphosphatase